MSDKIETELLALLDSDTVLIGVGNDISGDDGFGPELARRLKPFLGERAIDGGLAPENWTGPIAALNPKTLIIADAVAFGGETGEIRILDPDELESGLPATHGPGFSPLLYFLKGSLPQLKTIILAVQPSETGLMKPISKKVNSAIEKIVGAMSEAGATRASEIGEDNTNRT